MSHPSSSTTPGRLLELWLTLVHKALCRPVGGGILAWLPPSSPLLESQSLLSQIALSLDSDITKLTSQADALFGDQYTLCTIVDDIDHEPPSNATELSLKRVLSELQNHLLETSEELPGDAQLLAFLLTKLEYRSASVPVSRVTYHLVPDQGSWRVHLEGATDGQTFRTKDEALHAGILLARSHTAGQLIIHLADGRFEEVRIYGEA